MVEYLDPEIANEGASANNWHPGAWADTPVTSDEEYQPDLEPPHINDYSAFKKHKHYRQYFRPYRYVPFPAFLYHPTLGEKIVKSKEEAQALGPEWSPKPIKLRIDMTGKSLPVKSETQRLAEVVATALAARQGAATSIDATAIGAIVAAVMAAMGNQQAAAAPGDRPATGLETASEEKTERAALLDLAVQQGITVDGRWSNKKLKEALGL